MRKIKDLSGFKINKWTILDKSKIINKRAYWLCQCECGSKPKWVYSSNLQNGNTKGCGCKRKKYTPLTGQRFGKLIVTDYYYEVIISGQKYKKSRCICDCGGIIDVLSVNLKRKTKGTISCGCLAHMALPDNLSAKKALFYSYRKGAEERQYTFDLDFDTFLNMILLNCFYCGAEPGNLKKTPGGQIIYNGLDRVNNNEGYSKSNCVPCCKKCNSFKLDMSVNDFHQHVIKIYNYILGGK